MTLREAAENLLAAWSTRSELQMHIDDLAAALRQRRPSLTPKQENALMMIGLYSYEHNGMMPKLDELGEMMNPARPLSRQAVFDLVQALAAKGYVKVTKHKARGIKLLEG